MNKTVTKDDPSGENEIPVDRAVADIAIVCSHSLELRPFVRRLDRKRKYVDQGIVFRGGFLDEVIRVAVVEAGIGFAAHRRATEILVAEHKPVWIISAGFSSALSDEIGAGDLTMAREICDTHGNTVPVKCSIPESRRVRIHRHVVADRHPYAVADKLQLAADSAAEAVDTTSLSVAQYCSESKTRFLSIRAVVDRMGDEIPESCRAMLFAPVPELKSTLVSGLFRRLKRDPDQTFWNQRAQEAASHLDRFLIGVVLRLGELSRSK